MGGGPRCSGLGDQVNIERVEAGSGDGSGASRNVCRVEAEDTLTWVEGGITIGYSGYSEWWSNGDFYKRIISGAPPSPLE